MNIAENLEMEHSSPEEYKTNLLELEELLRRELPGLPITGTLISLSGYENPDLKEGIFNQAGEKSKRNSEMKNTLVTEEIIEKINRFIEVQAQKMRENGLEHLVAMFENKKIILNDDGCVEVIEK